MKFTTILALMAVSFVGVSEAVKMRDDADMQAKISAAIVSSSLAQALSLVNQDVASLSAQGATGMSGLNVYADLG
jgi:hypothetical protein